ncbi:MAG: hypothetical protein ABW003_08495 [Microvirga sp.]
MPLPASESRIASETLFLRTQATGQGATEQPAVPPGSERVEGAFGVFGMMIAGLIIIFALVLLFLRSRRRP